MDKEIATADKPALVEMVKLTQKRGMAGSQGIWKEFLKVHDKQFGTSLSDPAKRSVEDLAAFVKTFTKEEDIEMFKKVLECHSNMDLVVKVPDGESPEQSLVRSTITHPHFSTEYSFPTHEEGWVVTKLRKDPKKLKTNEMVAIDCEMVLCEDGTEALVKVCVVDRNLQVKLDELVNPEKPVKDYRTQITGVGPKDLKGVSCTLRDVQNSLKRILSRGRGTILVGHGLNNDLKALKLEHGRVIDTSYIFKHADAPVGRKPSLNNVCKFVLGCEVRKPGEPHNCLDDARAAMKIVLAKIECGLDEPIPLVQKDKPFVPETDMAKLFIHRIPICVTSEDLYKLIPGNHKIEIQPRKSIEIYSALATFESLKEADLAFETVSGVYAKDTSGRPQKLVTFKCIAGKTCSIYVRKMEVDSNNQDKSKKRTAEDPEEMSNESKKLKTDHQDSNLKEREILKELLKQKDQHYQDNVKEIENLKQILSQRDQEISTLHKIIASLTRKQGL